MIKELWKGNRVVRIISNDLQGPYTSTLWVNWGETCTQTRKKATTLKGALKQAEKILNR